MGSSSPVPFPVGKKLAREEAGGEEWLPWLGGRGNHWLYSLWGPLAQYQSPPLAIPAVRHGSNPYMSEQ